MNALIKRFFAAVLISCVLISLFGIIASAKEATQTYTHWVDTDLDKSNPVPIKAVYCAEKLVDSRSMQLSTGLRTVTDIYYNNSSKELFILDGKSGRAVILDNNYNVKSDFSEVTLEGQSIKFAQASGIYVNNNILYICDTSNGRILIIDNYYNQTPECRLMSTPPEGKMPKGFQYRPLRMTIDKYGYIYVLSDGCYSGALLFSPECEFLSFYGANRVKSTALQAMQKLWDIVFTTNAMRAASTRQLPYQFLDLCTDNKGFIYTVTGATMDSPTGQIKRLGPRGIDNLSRTSGTDSVSADTINFIETDKLLRGTYQVQSLCGVVVDSNYFIYAIDSTLGKIYIYDRDANPIAVFGGGAGIGEQIGTFKSASSLSLKDDGSIVFVADSDSASVTVFQRTEYGTNYIKAMTLTSNAEYDKAYPLWEDILKTDKNNQLAYCGLAKYFSSQHEYSLAMNYAKIGCDRGTYSQIFEMVRKDFISHNFWWIFFLIVMAVTAIIVISIYTHRHGVVLVKNEKIHNSLIMPIHPFESSANLKQRHILSIPTTIVIVALLYTVTFFGATKCSFLYSKFDANKYNALFTLAQTVGLFLLWVICNWAIAGLFQGKGTLKEVSAVTANSLVLFVGYMPIYILLTYLAPISSQSILMTLTSAVVLYTAYLLTVGIMVVHDFSFFKFLGTTILTVLGMLLVLFVMFMLGILIQQFGTFIKTIISEVLFR